MEKRTQLLALKLTNFALETGSIKVWDFGSGQLYKRYPDETTKKKREDTITGLAYHTMYNKRCLLVSSWGRKIRIMEVSNKPFPSCFEPHYESEAFRKKMATGAFTHSS